MSQSTSESKLQLWRQRFEQFNQSQLTVEQFCNSIDCSAATFYYWKQKLGRVGQANTLKAQYESAGQAKLRSAQDNPSAFVSVQLRGSTSNAVGAGRPVVLRLKDGTEVAVPTDALPALDLILRHVQRVAG